MRYSITLTKLHAIVKLVSKNQAFCGSKMNLGDADTGEQNFSPLIATQIAPELWGSMSNHSHRMDKPSITFHFH